ncbi:MAG: Mrp/NBP35 family ATP-binding protein [Leptospiraceae bacterium]|nr:Mrp/NBP35 family ATP-binding protein [Leptospiraceae bacterium]
MQILSDVEHPKYKQSVTDLGMFQRLEERDAEKVALFLKTPDEDRKSQIELETSIRTKATAANLPVRLVIKFEVDPEMQIEDAGNRIKGVKNILAVGSGKGGVGKSTVAANLAAALSLKGFKVGLIDGDIYGPSIGKLFGVSGRLQLNGDGKNNIDPHEVEGIKIISFSFLLNPDQAVVWRGPMLGKAIEQFLFQVNWGPLDYLILDLPPGTGDVQLSLAQLIDLDGAIIVTTPQNVALQDASRAAHMLFEVKIPVLGVIENMSGFLCPHCGKTSHIFSKNGAQAFAAKFHIPQLGQIPLQESIMESGEIGLPIVLKEKDGPIAETYFAIIEQMNKEIEKFR